MKQFLPLIDFCKKQRITLDTSEKFFTVTFTVTKNFGRIKSIIIQ